MHLRRLVDADGPAAARLIARDVFRGSLIQSLIARRGFESPLEFHGMFEGTGEGSLTGIITLDADGRSTMLGGGPEWAELLAGFIRRRAGERGLLLAFIDAPEEVAGALALAMPPQAVEDMGIWVCRFMAGEVAKAVPATETSGFVMRDVSPEDAAELESLFASSESFRGINIPDVMESWLTGQRPILVGCLGGRMVSAAFALLTDGSLARIGGVVTDPAFGGRGFATRVVGKLTLQLIEAGLTPFLYVSIGNIPAARLYRRLGYDPYATVVKLRYGDVRY